MTVSTPRKPGRPTKYNPAVAAKICQAIATSERSLRRILQADGMPTLSTVMLWKLKHPEFSEQYARAREDQADMFGDAVVEIADDAATPEEAQVARVRIDARKWAAGKRKPKVYGETRGDDGNMPTETAEAVAAKIREAVTEMKRSCNGRLA